MKFFRVKRERQSDELNDEDEIKLSISYTSNLSPRSNHWRVIFFSLSWSRSQICGKRESKANERYSITCYNVSLQQIHRKHDDQAPQSSSKTWIKAWIVSSKSSFSCRQVSSARRLSSRLLPCVLVFAPLSRPLVSMEYRNQLDYPAVVLEKPFNVISPVSANANHKRSSIATHRWFCCRCSTNLSNRLTSVVKNFLSSCW